jgi:hypothetical protein
LFAVDGDQAAVRVDVWYGDPVTQEYRDLWLLRFAADGRVEDFEEWADWPGRPTSAADADRAPDRHPRLAAVAKSTCSGMATRFVSAACRATYSANEPQWLKPGCC